MRRVVLLLFCFQLVSVCANAQTVTVRTGEHDAFTRVVLSPVRQGAWNTIETSTQVLIQLVGDDVSFETSSVYDRIRRTRAKEITIEGNVLIIEKGCECEASSYVSAGQLLVVDIFEKGQVVARQDANSPSFELGSLAPTEQMPREGTTILRSDEQDATSFTTVPLPGISSQQTYSGNDIRALRDEVSNELGMALTRGLLTPLNPNEISSVIEAPKVEIEERKEDENLGILSQEQNIVVQNLRSQLAGLTSSTSKPSIDACAISKSFDLPSWKPEKQFLEELARLRRSLYLEFDQVDKSVALELARLYAYHGFGAEAISTSKLAGFSPDDQIALEAISGFLEYSEIDVLPDAEELIHCEAQVALWAFISLDGSGSLNGFDERAIVREFLKLPQSVKFLVAPILSNRLRSVGYVHSSSLVLRETNLHLQEPNHDVLLEEARLDLDLGDQTSASAGFDDVANSDSLAAPQALIDFIDLQVEEGTVIGPDTAVLAEAYALQYRNSPIGPKLVEAHIKALSKTGQYFAALDLMRKNYPDGNFTPSLVETILTTATQDADDIDFLNLSYMSDIFAKGRVSDDVLLGVIERLQDLGMWDRSKEVLGKLHDGMSSEKMRLLDGKYHYATGDLASAFRILDPLENEEAKLLVATILLENESFSSSKSLFEEIRRQDRADTAARLLDFQEQINQGSNSVRAIDDVSLEQVQKLLSQSDALRENFTLQPTTGSGS